MAHQRIVIIGGGTGAYAALLGLKHYSPDITAVITMADDGGSSGLLRDQFGHLPPGDTRRALLALAPGGPSNALLRSLFEYRFTRGQGLSGHSFGNLLLTALAEIHGDMDAAVQKAARLLNIQGRVLPVTRDDTRLVAELADGTIIMGEHNIDVRTVSPDVPIKHVFLSPEPRVSKSAREAIESADLVVLGPGDLFTSLIPNLLVRGVPEALQRCRGSRLLVCNLMTKHGETDGFRASDFVAEVLHYLKSDSALDYLVANDGPMSPERIADYSAERAYPVDVDMERCRALGPQVVTGNILARGPLVRHDPKKLARLVMETHWRHVHRDLTSPTEAQLVPLAAA